MAPKIPPPFKPYKLCFGGPPKKTMGPPGGEMYKTRNLETGPRDTFVGKTKGPRKRFWAPKEEIGRGSPGSLGGPQQNFPGGALTPPQLWELKVSQTLKGPTKRGELPTKGKPSWKIPSQKPVNFLGVLNPWEYPNLEPRPGIWRGTPGNQKAWGKIKGVPRKP